VVWTAAAVVESVTATTVAPFILFLGGMLIVPITSVARRTAPRLTAPPTIVLPRTAGWGEHDSWSPAAPAFPRGCRGPALSWRCAVAAPRCRGAALRCAALRCAALSGCHRHAGCRLGHVVAPGGRGPLEVAIADMVDGPPGVVLLVVVLRAEMREIVVVRRTGVLPVLRMVEIAVPGGGSASRGTAGFVPHAEPGAKVGGESRSDRDRERAPHRSRDG
jgi:hypothetical protein